MEYRLVCSGTLYNGQLVSADWTKSVASRHLSPKYFTLLAANSRIDEYPQELALRFKCPLISEVHGNSYLTYRPDDEIARDIAALLTLFTRRLVTVACKVREISESPPAPDIFEPLRDFPCPVIGRDTSYWPPRPSTVITTPERTDQGWRARQEVKSYMPLPVPVNPEVLSDFFERILKLENDLASRFVSASRLYQNALVLLLENVDIAYQLLISAVETMSNAVHRGYSPSVSEIMQGRENLVEYLRKRLSKQDVEAVMKMIGNQIPWSTKKFVKFIEGYLPENAWEQPDPLYPGLELEHLIPKRERLAEVIKRIYDCRSDFSHHGRPYPAHVSIGTSTTISLDAMRALQAVMESDQVLPPITWFERVAQSTLLTFVMTQ